MQPSVLDPERAASRLRMLSVSLLGIGLALFAFVGVAYALGFRLNLTGSIPPGIYRISTDPVARGSIVLVCLPRDISEFARSRGYVPSGSCPDKSAPLGKFVVAMAGDAVEVGTDGVAVNDSLLRNSRPMPSDARGRQLHAFPAGTYQVRSNELWLVSSYSPRSFDSRYFGPVTTKSIVSRVIPVLKFH